MSNSIFPLKAHVWNNTFANLTQHLKKQTNWRQMYFYIFVYWPPFHVFHINLDMMECFVKFSPSLYSCQTHHLALLKPPFLPNKVHSLFCIFFCSWTRKYKLVIQLNTQHTMLSHTKNTPLRQQGCWVEPKGMWEVQYGWGGGAVQRFPPCFRYCRPFSQTNPTCTNPSALVTTKNLWLGINAVRPIRTGSKPREENIPGLTVCPRANSAPTGPTGYSWAQWYIIKNDKSYVKKKKKNKVIVKAIK